jgi:hypothetical protein
MLDVTRVYKLNNNITSNFNILHQNAILNAVKLNKPFGLRFTGNWNNSERCGV